MIIFTDAHCHFKEAILPADNISRCITNATNESDWKKLITLQSGNVFVCLGIHPWYIGSAASGWEKRLCQILEKNPKVMVGETGLDKFKPNITSQEDFFVQHLEIAHNMQRTLHLHCVGAWERILHILKSNPKILPPKILIHCFSGDSDLIPRLADKYNAYFSYSVPKTSTNTTRILLTPNDRLLVESDVDAIADASKKLNQAYADIAEIKKLSVSDIAQITNSNFQRILNQ